MEFKPSFLLFKYLWPGISLSPAVALAPLENMHRDRVTLWPFAQVWLSAGTGPCLPPAGNTSGYAEPGSLGSWDRRDDTSELA